MKRTQRETSAALGGAILPIPLPPQRPPYAELSPSCAMCAKVRLLDDTTFEMHARYPLQPQESACSILWTSFAGDAGGPLLVVGTAYVLPDEPEPTSGRILVFEIQERHGHSTK